jgi:hypothetical protein
VKLKKGGQKMSDLIQFKIVKPEGFCWNPYLQIKFSSCNLSQEIKFEGELDELMDNQIKQIEKARKQAKKELKKMLREVQDMKEAYKASKTNQNEEGGER